MMPQSSKAVAFCVLAAACGVLLASPASAACSAQDLAELPGAPAAVDAWATEHGVGLPTSMQSRISDDFCAAARAIASASNVRIRALDDHARDSIFEYLDRTFDTRRPGRRMDSILASRLGTSGFSPPVGKLYGFIKVTAAAPLTAIKVNDESVPVRPLIMYQIGTAVLKGYRGGQEACRAQVEVEVGKDYSVGC